MKVSLPFHLLALLFCSASFALAEPEETIISRIQRAPVASSNVASIGYSRHLRALEIEFRRGAVYRFLDVPADVYYELLAAESKGRYINTRLRGRYRFLRVRRPHRNRLLRDHSLSP